MRKIIQALLVYILAFAPASAAVTIADSNTTSSDFVVRVLPANSTTGQLLVSHPSAANGNSLAVKSYATENIRQVANGTYATLDDLLNNNGVSLVDSLPPGFVGSNQTQNIQFVVCESVSNGFAASQKFFLALPSAWDLNLENGSSITTTNIVTTETSNGISLSAITAANLQQKTATTRAGLAVTISSAGITNGSSTTRDCFLANFQHENLMASSSSAGTTANAYIYNGGNSLTTRVIADSSNATDVDFVSEIFDSSVLLSLPEGDDVLNDFSRTSSGSSGTNESQTVRLTAGAIRQSFAAPTSITRYRSAGTTDVYALLLEEPSKRAWNLFDGPSVLKPTNTLDSTSPGANQITISCELDSEGDSVVLTGTPKIISMTGDLSFTSIAAATKGEVTFTVSTAASFAGDPNDVQSKILITGLQLAATTLADNQLRCLAKIKRAGSGGLVETIAAAEGMAKTASASVALPIFDTSAGDAFNGYVAELLNASPATTPTAYDNSSTDTLLGNTVYFTQLAEGSVVIAGDAVNNGTTALKTVTDANLIYGVSLSDVPTESKETNDLDKLATVTIASHSLSAGLPLTLSSDGPSLDASAANSVKAAVDKNGGSVLKIRVSNGQNMFLSAPSMNGTSTQITIKAEAKEIDPQFFTNLSMLYDGADGMVAKGKAVVVFEVNGADTIGFDFADVLETSTLNNNTIRSLGNDKYAALVRANSNVFILKSIVDGDAATTNIVPSTAFVTASKGKKLGKVKIKDQREKKSRILFKTNKTKFPKTVTAFVIDANADLNTIDVIFNKKRNKLLYQDAATDIEFICLNAAGQTQCFDLGD